MDKIEERYNKLKEELSRLEDKESNLALLLTDFMHEMEEEHPNLLKNENERIADEIIQFLYLPHPQFVGKREHEKWIAWLEKQAKLVKYYEDKLDKCACDNFNKGYKKALEKQLEKKLPKGEDYGIDGLYHAIRILEKTLGKVDGYQTDDGILEHQCAISAVKELGKKKLIEWRKEDADNK